MSTDTPKPETAGNTPSSTANNGAAAPDDVLQDMIAESDTGARKPEGIPKKILWFVPLAWSSFQLWYASPLPFMTGILNLNSTEARAVHLAFAIFLAYTAYPTFKSSPRDYIPIQDWILAIVAAMAASYLFVFNEALADRPGLPTDMDLVCGVVGMALLLEATRRALGPPLMVVGLVFLLYTFAGSYMPDVIAHQGASLSKGMSHYWLTTEGVYGIALGVSTSMVFLFVLFGALLERAGAGNYFIRVAFAFMGHMRGGPAKAAVVSSGMTGLVSGSSIANVVTTGTFTIPLMKRVGFSAEKAGAVEVASSTNGQLTPPVMGAAAFLMVEFVGISYTEVITHAFLPAIISYIALVYIVHLEALKADMKGLPRRFTRTIPQALISFFMTVAGLVILSGIVYYGLGWTKDVAGDATPYIATVFLVIAYVGLAKVSCGVPDLPFTVEIDECPDPKPTVLSGLYFLLPVVVLVWCLTVERLSPGLSAFWATAFMTFVVLTQKPLKAFLRKQGHLFSLFKEGICDVLEGMVTGARNMIGIGVATAAAGIIVGTITLTGIGQVMTEFVELISGGSLILILIFTAIISLILGMGLPTTANYIVVSSLMAPVIVTLGAENGLIVPLIAVHLFVFYFGILADDTPPVGLAAFAAAAISGGDPIKTGIQGFTYDMRTAILPFIFIFNTQILMIGINHWWEGVITVVSAVAAMLAFGAATQGYFIQKSKIYETIALLLVAFTLLRPGYWMDMIYPPLISAEATKIYELAEALPNNAQIRVRVTGIDLDDNEVDKVVMLPLGPTASGEERIAHTGLELREVDGKMIVDNIVFGSVAEKQKIDFDYEIASVQVQTERPPKQLFFIPAFALYFMIYLAQRRRRGRVSPEAVA